MTQSRTFHAERAWLGGTEPAADVRIETEGDRIVSVESNVDAPNEAHRLNGLTLPGLVNTHSHVFHRAIRGHSQSGVSDFWEWRDLMYDLAQNLDPDSLYNLAYATFVEMALSGITLVGEYHYLHHDIDGTRYAEPNAMSSAILRAAEDVGIRITLLDSCYLQGDIEGGPLEGAQRRFSDGSWENWAERVEATPVNNMSKLGAGIHSVRAVPRQAMAPIADFAENHDMPVHIHVSEQPAENEACLDVHGMTPTELLSEEEVLGPNTTAIHATHLTDTDIELLGDSNTPVCMCCTTERDLADGVGPAVRLTRAGSPLCVGSDAHMMIDLWEEARAIELNKRLISGDRGHLGIDELLTTVTEAGASSLGWDTGQITPGALADLVTVNLDTPRTAGARAGNPLAQTIFAASSADVSNVVVGGQPVVENGQHVKGEQPGSLLNSAVETALSDNRSDHQIRLDS